MYGQRLYVTQARVNGLVLIDAQLNSKRGNTRAALEAAKADLKSGKRKISAQKRQNLPSHLDFAPLVNENACIAVKGQVQTTMMTKHLTDSEIPMLKMTRQH